MAPKGAPRERLDRILVLRGLAPTRTRAQALILAGRVRSGEARLDKPGTRYPADLPLSVNEGRRFVGRGAHKLQQALDTFGIVVEGRDALDVGASTGGFTQVLLEAGARRVIALDVGRGQLDWSLRSDPRVHPLEGVNARNLRAGMLPFPPSFASIDVSFISLELVLPPVVRCLAEGGEIVALVKPQFEAGRGQVGKGGVVRDPAIHREVLERVIGFAGSRGWGVRGVCASPIRGADGNREFLVHVRPAEAGEPAAALRRRIDDLARPERIEEAEE
jgi:23S rRNA (cytidine1920-2'-O)/16S rRNA (cytidine1409-2'-O)-methyltransferase